MTVYLVHFARPFKHAKHYIGYTDLSLQERFKRHMSNAQLRRGSALLRAVIEAGIKFKVVRTWDGDREVEKRKKNGHATRQCPVCRGLVSYSLATDLLTERES